MSRDRFIGTLFCLLSLWLQMVAPALALSMQRQATDPFSVICHAGSAQAANGQAANHQGDHRRTPHTPACDHCVVCHAVAGGLAADGRPPFTRLDYPASSPLRWVQAGWLVPVAAPDRIAQPRGPPLLV